MRILVVHNRYSSRVPSGENLAVADEVRWLREAGVDVEVHQVSNDEVVSAGGAQRARQAASATWSRPARRAVEAAIDRVAPDAVHVHNLFPLLTASVPWAARHRGLPVVWTVHNHRLTCVIGTNHREGQPCRQCRPGWRVPGIRHGCYGGSAAASALVTGATSLFRGVARRDAGVTAVAVSESIRRWLTGTAGFAPERVVVKPNGVAGPPPGTTPPPAAGNRVLLFAGYLIDYKGVELLLDAWDRARAGMPGGVDVELRILGDGPLAGRVEEAARRDARITWRGLVPAGEVARHLADARAVVVPSVWEEPFGRNAAEALAHGRPVVTTGTGGLAEVVDGTTGWVTGTDPAALAAALVEAAISDTAVADRAGAAVARHRARYSPEATTRALVDVYARAIAGARPGGPDGPAGPDGLAGPDGPDGPATGPDGPVGPEPEA